MAGNNGGRRKATIVMKKRPTAIPVDLDRAQPPPVRTLGPGRLFIELIAGIGYSLLGAVERRMLQSIAELLEKIHYRPVALA